MEFSQTNSLFNSLHQCLFGEISDEELTTKDAILDRLGGDITDRIWCRLVDPETPFEYQMIAFNEEVKSNFMMFHTNDHRAVQLAGVLRNKVDKLALERNRFIEKVSVLWGISTDEVQKWVDVDPDFFIHDLKIRANADSETTYDEYRFCNYVGLIVAATNQTILFCQDYLSLYGYTTSTNKESEPTETGVKLKWNCNPATTGYIIATLIRAGYIEPPFGKNEEVNRTELARICMQLFEFTTASPTIDTWRKNLDIDSDSGNQFSNDNREKFTIPHTTKLNKSNSSTVRTPKG